MQKIVINKCYGGFSLSDEAVSLMNSRGIKDEDGDPMDTYPTMSRDNPELVKIVEELGDKANGCHADLRVVEIPDGINWEIEEYDGQEWVSETHRTWN